MHNITFKTLNANHVEESHAMLNSMIEHLKLEGHGDFLLPKTEEQISNKIAEGSTIGAFNSKGKLIGEASLSQIPENDPRGNNLDSKIPNISLDNISNSSLMLLDSVVVNVEYQGHGIATKIYKKLLSDAKDKTIITQVSTDNVANINNSIKQGFLLTQSVIDPYDEANIYYLVKPSMKFNLLTGISVGVPISSKDGIKELLSRGYIGASINRKDNNIILSEGSEVRKHLGCKQEANNLNLQPC